MIENWQIREILRDVLGSEVADREEIAAGAGEMLRQWAPYRQKLNELAKDLENYLFNQLYNALGERMTVRLDNGSERRIRMSELPELTDMVTEVLLDQMKVYSVNYEILRDYAVRSGSSSAMKVLVRRFGRMQPADERQRMIAVLAERGWILKEKGTE